MTKKFYEIAVTIATIKAFNEMAITHSINECKYILTANNGENTFYVEGRFDLGDRFGETITIKVKAQSMSSAIDCVINKMPENFIIGEIY